jgi:integrase
MKTRLTKKVVDGLEARVNRYDVWDDGCTGFHVRVSPAGSKIFYLVYRDTSGKQRKPRIGEYGKPLTVDAARKIADNWARKIAAGDAPEGALPMIENPTVLDLEKRYMQEYAAKKQKPRTRANNKSYWKCHVLPRFGDRRVRDIEYDDIAALHLEMCEKQTTANRVLEMMTKAFALAEFWNWREKGTNPCEWIEAYPEAKRKRYLTPQESKRIGATLRTWLTYNRGSKVRFAQLVLLLIYTGARLNEIMASKISWIDWERGILDLPDSKTGQKELMLTAAALEILQQISDNSNSKWIIPGDASKRRKGGGARDEDIHMVYPYDLWHALKIDAEIEDLRIHDLRHAYASLALYVTKDLTMVGGLLGHADAKTTQRYAHLMDDPKRFAAESTAEKITEMLSPSTNDDDPGDSALNVVRFPNRA